MKKFIVSALAATVMLSAFAAGVSAENDDDGRETLDDTPVVITLAPDPVVTEAPAETTAAPEVVVTTPAVKSSVKTGQAPYALVAVPVGMAAAALLLTKKKKESK